MGRGKIELKRIEDKSSRQVTFSKRRKGLMKKARELAVLCDVELSLFIFSAGGRFYEFSSGDSLSKILERYQSHRRPGDAVQENVQAGGVVQKDVQAEEAVQTNVQHVQEARTIGAEASGTWNSADLLQMVQRNLDGEKAEELNITELTQLEHQLNAILRQTRVKKEKLLREEKQLLDEEVAVGITEREEN